MNLRRSSFALFFVLAFSGTAYASSTTAPAAPPPAAVQQHVATPSANLSPLAHGAVEHVGPEARQILSTARTSAATERAKADDTATVHAEETKAVRHDIASRIVGARQGLRTNAATLDEKHEAHSTATLNLSKKQEEIKAAETKATATEGSLSWLARTTKVSFSPKVRATLARWKEEKAEHVKLSSELETAEQDVAALADDVKKFEGERAKLVETLKAEKGRAGSWKAEAARATDAKVAALRAGADKIEAEAKTAIQDRVKAYVASQVAPRRNPISSARGESETVIGDADRVKSTIHSADSAVSNALSVIQRKQADRALESAFGTEQNGFSKIVNAVDDYSEQSATSDAQSKLAAVDSALSHLRSRATALKQTVSGLNLGVETGGLDHQAARVNVDVATVAFVDVALDFAGLENSLTSLGLGLLEQSSLHSASSNLRGASSSVAATRNAIVGIRDQLDSALQHIDAESAKVVNEAVQHLVAQH